MKPPTPIADCHVETAPDGRRILCGHFLDDVEAGSCFAVVGDKATGRFTMRVWTPDDMSGPEQLASFIDPEGVDDSERGLIVAAVTTKAKPKRRRRAKR